MLTGGVKKIYDSKSKLPLVTIITVVFNGESVLEKTIKSIINQTYKNIEYIIIDGNSTDNTINIIKKYEKSISYWQSEPDCGIYDAMNKGISLSSGNWINFMNAGDTFYGNNVLSSLFSIGNNYEGIDILYGNSYTFSNKKIVVNKLTKRNLIIGRTINHQSIFARKEVFIGNYFDINYKIMADKNWLCKAFLNNKTFEYVDLPICYYDLEGISFSNKKRYFKESKTIVYKLFGVLPFIMYLFVHFIVFLKNDVLHMRRYK